MPSNFETAFATDGAPGMYDSFGIPAAYTDPAGNLTSGLIVRLHRNEAHETTGNARSNELQTGEILILQSALHPVRGGRFVVESVEAWSIVNQPRLVNGQYLCQVQRVGLERIGPMRAKET